MTSDLSGELASTRVVEQLLAMDDEEALENALAAAEPVVAARAVNLAPNLEQKTTLLWALEDRKRREVLDLIPPALVGALVQNLEEDNRYLLGDLSLEQYRALIRLCSPERQWYWVTTALSFTDARANLLPLLLTTRELVEILMTRGEFEEHLRAIADYPLENQRIPAEMMDDPAQGLVDLIGPVNMLREFPISEVGLAQALQTILDYDPDRYVDIIREGLRVANYAENHPLEWDDLSETPVLLDHIDAIPQEPAPRLPSFEDVPDFEVGPPLALVPLASSPLARIASALPPATAERISVELQHLFVRQAIAEGGSFLEADLRRVARSVEAYLMLGLQAESGGATDGMLHALAGRPLHKISQSGARVVESLRQVAYRLQPLERIFSAEERAVIQSIVKPRLTTAPDGSPRLLLMPAGKLPDDVDFATAAALLGEVAAWASLARGLGLDRTAKALAEGLKVDRLLEELAVAAAIFGRVDLGLIAPEDRARFGQRFLSRVEREPLPEAREAVRRAVEAWAREKRIEPGPLLPLFDRALDRIGVAALAGE